MSATNDLFTRWKAHKGIESDRQGAAALGVSHAGPAQWRAGRNGSASVIERMCKDLGEDAVPVILQAFAEAARDAEDKRTLGRLARRLGAACVALTLLAPMMIAAPTMAAESTTAYTLCAVAMLAVIAWINRFRGFDSPRHQPRQLEPLTCDHPASCLASQ